MHKELAVELAVGMGLSARKRSCGTAQRTRSLADLETSGGESSSTEWPAIQKRVHSSEGSSRTIHVHRVEIAPEAGHLAAKQVHGCAIP